MVAISFSDQGHSLSLNISYDEASSHSDALVDVTVNSHDMTGLHQVWVGHAALQAFFEELQDLDRTHHGEAQLFSLSPDELNIRVFSCDRHGNLAISGSLYYQVYARNSAYDHRLTFGFDLEPIQLSLVVNHPKIREQYLNI